VLAYEGFDPQREGLREALCTLGNGRFATRGAAPEARADDVHYPGTYAAGVYNRLTTAVGAREVENEDLVNLPNWLPLAFRIDGGPWFHARAVELLEYRQELDLRGGILTRRVRFRNHDGFESTVTQRRFVHMDDARVAGLETSVLAENWSGRLDVRSELDGTVLNAGVARYRDLANRHLRLVEQGAVDDESVRLVVETTQSHVRIALAARTRALVNGEPAAAEIRLLEEAGRIGHELSLDLARGHEVTVEKVVTMFTSRDHAVSDPGDEAGTWVTRADSFGQLHERHRLAWDRLWERFEIAIKGNARTQLLLRLHVFHLLQSLSTHTIDLDVGVPARGLHGEAYRGHVFWDELFVLPVLNYRLPILTRSLLEYRHRRLRAARWAAREQGYRGALFPWQSGSDGREETQRLHLNPRSGRWLPDHSHLQRHVNLAIAYNVWQYFQVTGDLAFLRYHGAEIIVEVARLFASLATFDPVRERYDILGVMGPDEYHDAYPGREEPGLDNNAYTNVMAAWLMCRALETMEVLPLHLQKELKDELRVTEEELGRWEDLSRRIFVPFHDGVISQFEGYEDLEELDWKDYRSRYGDIGRLDRILEAEGDTPNRYRLSKQADVLMLFYLLSPGELTELFDRLGYAFEPERDVPRNVDYYLARTSDGSTLSGVVHSWVLARLDRGRSWAHLMASLESDVADVQGGTTREGIHLGAMAGTVDIVQRAYMGLAARNDCLWFDPGLPDEVISLDTELHYRDHRIRVEVRPDVVRLTTRPGTAAPIRVGFRNVITEVHPGTVTEWPLDPAGS
jgi:alpha,alpha-trehalase